MYLPLLWLIPRRPGWQECNVFGLFHMNYQSSFGFKFLLAVVTTTMMDFSSDEIH